MKLTDIARLAGVSVTTASYVVNGQAARRRISQATVDRVLEIVRQQGYQPDQQAAGLRRGQSRTLGFIVPDLENPSYARLAKCLERMARQRGYQLLIASSDDDPDTERQVLRVLRSRRCDALIVASCLPMGDDTYQRLLKAGLPVVAVDRALDPAAFHSVVSDDRAAGRALTASLLGRRPNHIALISARPELPISQAREQGFREALEGFDGRVSVLQAAEFSRACGREQALALLDAPLPDALITTAYVLLEGVFDALHERAQLWPDELQLATFGDAQLLDFLPVPVNAISQQHEAIARRVLDAALAAVEQGEYRPGIEAIERLLKRRQSALAPEAARLPTSVS
ncbi:catabolite repressor/activator [Stutzerimonas urumqiensis]|uniref:catabolite repressor/activator n=1 Tax=Stutzerimonas urumqiensis TaxID=638269 RepID=UPI000EB29949|nr:catabolite repressor/activator [Stutzerimonas urumqiensis]